MSASLWRIFEWASTWVSPRQLLTVLYRLPIMCPLWSAELYYKPFEWALSALILVSFIQHDDTISMLEP